MHNNRRPIKIMTTVGLHCNNDNDVVSFLKIYSDCVLYKQRTGNETENNFTEHSWARCQDIFSEEGLREVIRV